jgi:hypothetical protein
MAQLLLSDYGSATRVGAGQVFVVSVRVQWDASNTVLGGKDVAEVHAHFSPLPSHGKYAGGIGAPDDTAPPA